MDEVDFSMFWKLSSMYHAVAMSATAPVVFPTGLGGIFSHAFYYTFDNEGEILQRMWARIRAGSNEIRESYLVHARMRDEFYSIQEALNGNQRDRAVHHIAQVHDRLIDYTKLVDFHRERLSINAFLPYPSCPPGHIFSIRYYPDMRTNEFNPEQTREGIVKESQQIKNLVEEFAANPAPVQNVTLTDLFDMGEGVIDSSLRGRLALTKELLKRVGYLVPEEE